MPPRVDTAEIGAFYEREMPRLVLFVTISTGLDTHAAADVAQTSFEKALPRWPTLRNPRAWLYQVAHHEALARSEAVRREVPVDAGRMRRCIEVLDGRIVADTRTVPAQEGPS